MSIPQYRNDGVNLDFHTDFEVDHHLEPILGVQNEGRVNRSLVTQDEVGRSSFSALLERVQYGTYHGSPACLIAVDFTFRFRSKVTCRYSYAEIRVAFTRAIDTQNHKLRVADCSDDPRVKNMAPMEVYRTVKMAGDEKIYDIVVPEVFKNEIGDPKYFRASKKKTSLHAENQAAALGRLYYDDDHPQDPNAVVWELYESGLERDGIFRNLRVAIVIVNAINKPMWMEVVVKPSVRVSLDVRHLAEKSGLFSRLLQRNDHPVLLDGKTSKEDQLDLGCDDFSSPAFPWHRVLHIPVESLSQWIPQLSSTPALKSQSGGDKEISDVAIGETPSPRNLGEGGSKPLKVLPNLQCKDYNVAWICALPHIELLAARLMLDKEHTRPLYDNVYDDNTYIFGEILRHNIVMATLPKGQTGNVNAGRLTASMFKTFPNIGIVLLVGIGGGVPQSTHSYDPLRDIHLGDVVVGWPGDGEPAVVYWDSGRTKVNGVFEALGTINRPEWKLTQALAVVSSNHDMKTTKFDSHLARLKMNPKFATLEPKQDRLFRADYHHIGDYDNGCLFCDSDQLVQRSPRPDEYRDSLVFHQGRIATGNSVVQDAARRDKISKECNDVLCIEMEAAGVDVNRPCLVIRGISDYSDSHKNDGWKFCAAGSAAAFARELLETIP